MTDNIDSYFENGKGFHSNPFHKGYLTDEERKTAWKRFYKMFPDLKGMKVIPGKSSCYARDKNREMRQQIQHSSTIKLKKV